MQELGLQKAYSEDDAVYKYVRKLMALPFLPHRQIRPMFLRLQAEAETEPIQNLVTYIRRQWIESTVFPPRNWSVYQQAIRTNNDIEGWHNALNRRASGQSGLPLYLLIELLDRGAKFLQGFCWPMLVLLPTLWHERSPLTWRKQAAQSLSLRLDLVSHGGTILNTDSLLILYRFSLPV